ncbi:MAG: cell division protein FtsH, partial [Armatimonadetes bacterium]|nr:cell division protein FtsH [Armatimonadota bacterium]
ENRQKMDAIVKVLLEKETLEREEFGTLMEGASLSAGVAKPPVASPTPAEPKVGENVGEKVERKPEKKPRLEPGVA